MPRLAKAATKKGPGRPATGRHPVIGGRVPQATVDAMDAWAVANGVTRSEAVGRLIALGLKRATARKQ